MYKKNLKKNYKNNITINLECEKINFGWQDKFKFKAYIMRWIGLLQTK